MTARNILIYIAIKYQSDYDKMLDHITKHKDCNHDEVEKTVASLKCNVLTILDDEYPDYLKKIVRPPLVLFYQGDLSLIRGDNHERSLAIAGSRSYTEYGADNIIKIMNDLADSCNIVSGVTIGVSSIAIVQALKNAMKVIAVLPAGINSIVPAESQNLVEQIIKHGGLVLTEYPDDTQPVPDNYINRNRIIAAVSAGVFIPQSKGEKTGTDVLIRYALNLDRPVMCLPCNVDSPLNGNNTYIRMGVADLVCDAEDILFNLERGREEEQ